MGQKLVITEDERNNIRNMYNPHPKRDYVFECMITVDGRYLIFQDEVYDNVEQKNIGNIWESIEKFKIIFKNVQIEDSDYMIVRENIMSIPIVESQDNLYGLRNYLIQEGFFNDTWVGRELKKTGQGISNFATTSWEGAKKFGVAVSQGKWAEILNLLGKGAVFILRSLKDALYSSVGMVVDAILVATGIGKTGQWIPWALVLGLDVYQMISNDWPEEDSNSPMWSKWLTIGFDVLGLTMAGAVAKSAKVAAKPLIDAANNPTLMMKILEKSPNLKTLLTTMVTKIKNVPNYINKAIVLIGKKMPSIGKFLSSIIGKLSTIIKTFTESFSKLLGKKVGDATVKTASKEGIKSGSMLYGMEKGMEKVFGKPQNTLGDLMKSSNVTPSFNFDDI